MLKHKKRKKKKNREGLHKKLFLSMTINYEKMTGTPNVFIFYSYTF